MTQSSLSAFLLRFRARTWAKGRPLLIPKFCPSHSKYLPPAAQNTVCNDNGYLASANFKEL